ncbi:hypothetical protein ABZ504_48815, partial [Streptomyces mirabilis]|uniref:hypothetical protein n=1 Tax=Streptomyces mirabilis TaxID=68239 RepID=UPI0033E73579
MPQPPVSGRADDVVVVRATRSECGGRRLPTGVTGVRSERVVWGPGARMMHTDLVAALDIGGTKIAGALVDGRGRI